MKKSIAIFARDKYLRQKIYLMLAPYHDVRCHDVSSNPSKADINADIVIWNINDKPLPSELYSYSVTLGDGGNVPLPFTEKMLLDALNRTEEKNPAGKLTLGEKCAHIYGKTVHLTDAEFALLSALVEANGCFVTRENLIREVWGDSTTDGILNVYIHYLREKIEFRGEKIIISSRKFGYKIDERFLCVGGAE